MQVHSGLKPISLSASTLVFVATFILLVLPLTLGFVFFDSIYGFYLSEFVASDLERDMGFHAGTARVQHQGGVSETYAILQVDPAGVLGKAGVRPGDVPCGYMHGIKFGFLDHLHDSRGREAELSFCRPPAWATIHVKVVVPRGAR